MTTLMDRVRAYLRSPKGRQTVEKRNQQKARRFLDRLRSRRH
jgi:hypothetical protein